MTLFFSRRTYNARTDKFTINAAKLTRYVEITSPGISVQKGHLLERATWKAKVLAKAETPDLVIYVHGYNTSQIEMLRRQRKIEDGLRANGYRGAVVGYDWPSDGELLAYSADIADAKKVAPYLVTQGIALFLNETPRMKIHVIAHSMGAYLTLRGFSGVGDAPGARKWGVDQMLTVAADADAEWMRSGAWGSLVMAHRANRITNYHSTADKVLKKARFFNGMEPRLGRQGLPDLVPTSHFDLRCTEQYRDKVHADDQNLRYSHTWYFDDDGFLKDAALTIAGKAADQMETRQARPHSNDQMLMT